MPCKFEDWHRSQTQWVCAGLVMTSIQKDARIMSPGKKDYEEQLQYTRVEERYQPRNERLDNAMTHHCVSQLNTHYWRLSRWSQGQSIVGTCSLVDTENKTEVAKYVLNEMYSNAKTRTYENALRTP